MHKWGSQPPFGLWELKGKFSHDKFSPGYNTKEERCIHVSTHLNHYPTTPSRILQLYPGLLAARKPPLCAPGWAGRPGSADLLSDWSAARPPGGGQAKQKLRVSRCRTAIARYSGRRALFGTILDSKIQSRESLRASSSWVSPPRDHDQLSCPGGTSI